MPAGSLTLPRPGRLGQLSLLGMPKAELVEFFENIGEKPYRAQQIMRWLYQRRVTEYAEMTDLSASLRKQLAEMTALALPPVLKHEHSDDGTRKWLLDVGANQAVETVYIPEPDRGTLCISSQAGCALDCAFCATGYQGFNRNLTSAEILGQVVLAARELAPAKMNLIPFNAFPESGFRCSPQPVIDAFWQTLRNAGLIATIRRPRGDDIAAACGQLAGRVRDRQRVRLGDRVIGASSS